ncbi:MAG: hypothetical protein K2Y22_01145 [Candidatus Obscuribacterales bacterium]|nr:hypothetical protein [Candidatus Obscuribacterales bacterium]
MVLDEYEILALGAAVVAVMMLGMRHLRPALAFYALCTFMIVLETILVSFLQKEVHLFFVAIGILVIKVVGVPLFLNWIMKRIDVRSDSGIMAPPISMHAGIMMLGVSYLLASQLPGMTSDIDGRLAATGAMSLIFTGVLIMLTRKIALSQIIGFLVLENGIYLFALTQAQGMPMIVEMGILLDVLAAVMISGLLLFRIKKSFEHIDVTQLTELRDI